MPPGRTRAAQVCDEGGHVRDVLHHLQADDGIVQLACRHQFFGGHRAIVDVEALAGGVVRGRWRYCVSPGSMPVTRAPRRASGSDMRPPPQPTSMIRRSFRGAGRRRRGRNGA